MSLENQQKIENVKEYYEILRTRQMQIIQIIRETSFLLSKMESHPHPPVAADSGRQTEKNLDNGLRLAFNMINSLANILDEQMQALDVWERVLLDENPNRRPGKKVDYGLQDYYEINPN